MPVKFVEKIGGLDEISPEDTINPANAVKAQYFDPFRDGNGNLAGAFGFKSDSPTDLPADWHTDGNKMVLGAFKLGGWEHFIVGDKQNQAPGHENVRLYYINDDNVIALVPNKIPNGQFLLPINFVPRRIFVDPFVYKVGRGGTDIYADEISQVYLFGHNMTTNQKVEPIRLIMIRVFRRNEYIGVTYWYVENCDSIGIANRFLSSIEEEETDANWTDEYRYIVVLEDVAGNYIHPPGEDSNFLIDYDADGKRPRLQFTRPAFGGTGLFISKIHIYRVNVTAVVNSEGWDDISDYDWELIHNSARWKASITPSALNTWIDYDETEDSSGDLLYPTYANLVLWQSNVNEAHESIGFHNNAFWISRGNEAFFSQYTLSAPHGTRPLNFPTNNRWKFEGIGTITDMVSADNKLIVFGTEGISTLAGSYLDNFFEQKISSVGTNVGRPEYGEYNKTVTVVDDRIFFINSEGEPSFYYGGVINIMPGIKIKPQGTTTRYQGLPGWPTIYVLDAIDACRYRDGWMVTNGSTIYLLDIANGRWVEWPEGVTRFIIGLDPFYENRTLSTTVATIYDYFRFIDESGIPRVYATNGTYANAIWRIPKAIFQNDQRFHSLILHWKYNGLLPYGGEDIDSASRTAENPKGQLKTYLDDASTAIKTIDIDLIHNSDGEYLFKQFVNCRGRKFAFELDMSASKYFYFTGWELKHEDRGRKSFD